MKKIKEKIKNIVLFTLSIFIIVFLVKFLWNLLKFLIPLYVVLILINVSISVINDAKRIFQLHKNNKKMKKELGEKNLRKLEKNSDYTEKRLAGLSKIKGKNGEVFYAEEYVPISFEDLENIQDREMTLNQTQEMETYFQSLEKYQKLNLNGMEREQLEAVKKELILYSFKLQEAISKNNVYLNAKTEDLYKNKEKIEMQLKKAKTRVNKQKNNNFCK
ncbi:MAG: hypothetical protein HFJ02_06645 [Bacilli bacterium]|nr:hypothetical protein [Bacilli bacterium]